MTIKKSVKVEFGCTKRAGVGKAIFEDYKAGIENIGAFSFAIDKSIDKYYNKISIKHRRIL